MKNFIKQTATGKAKLSGTKVWRISSKVRIYHDDFLQQLPLLSRRAALVFCDPPYNQGVDYGRGAEAYCLSRNAYLAWSRQWLEACCDALCSNGSLWVLCPEEWEAYIAVALDALGLHRRSWIKWYETFGVNCRRKFNRCSRHLLYYVVDSKRFIFNSQAVTRPSDRQTKYGDKRAKAGGKIWDDVWQIPRLAGTHKERLQGMPNQLPKALLRPIVGCATNKGDMVVDSFCGSGTTGAVCLELGRRFVGIERELGMCRTTVERLTADAKLHPT